MAHVGRALALVVVLALCGCDGCEDSPPGVPGASSAAAASSSAPQAERPPLRTREGSAIAVSHDGDTLLVADEDRRVLWRLGLPLENDSRPTRIELPGAPAQVLALHDRVLVTIRDPGLLLVIEGDVEKARVEVPADAWGLAVSADLSTALVSSAWTHAVSAIDLPTLQLRWTRDVAREPRGIVMPSEGDRAYVTHLMGTELTRIDAATTGSPSLSRVSLPPAPSLSPPGHEVGASLGYDAVLSPDESRLFVARHALGAIGTTAHAPTWFGAATVDVLSTKKDAPLAMPRRGKLLATMDRFKAKPKNDNERAVFEHMTYGPVQDVDGPMGPAPLSEATPFVAPRAIVYRKATRTLLVASEGGDELVEVDALAVEPARHRLKRYRLGAGYDPYTPVATSGGAPSGIALSPDESLAYVFCRTTYDVAAVPLVALDEHSEENPVVVRLAEDPVLEGVDDKDPKRGFREAAAHGRRLFHNAIDGGMSLGMACAGCHPEGRDDGHVWHEASHGHADTEPSDLQTFFVGGSGILAHHAVSVSPFPHFRSVMRPLAKARQTPMLAGRVRGEGPYGWHAESKSLVDRIKAGFHLHRWGTVQEGSEHGSFDGRARAIAAFLRDGLVPPPRRERELTPDEERGKALFASDQVGCAACHLPDDEYTNRAAVAVKAPGKRKGFVDETGEKFKTPSLLYVGGTAPYYHDGSSPTLEALIANNDNRMGNTNHLSAADRAALVAFLKTL